jgi:hypothetical protein
MWREKTPTWLKKHSLPMDTTVVQDAASGRGNRKRGSAHARRNQRLIVMLPGRGMLQSRPSMPWKAAHAPAATQGFDKFA